MARTIKLTEAALRRTVRKLVREMSMGMSPEAPEEGDMAMAIAKEVQSRCGSDVLQVGAEVAGPYIDLKSGLAIIVALDFEGLDELVVLGGDDGDALQKVNVAGLKFEEIVDRCCDLVDMYS